MAEYRFQHPHQIIHWSSQPDSGIYDAWNRGLTLATGTYLGFIGADDTFLDAASVRGSASEAQSADRLTTAQFEFTAKDWSDGMEAASWLQATFFSAVGLGAASPSEFIRAWVA